VLRNQEEHRKNSARESYDEHGILNAKPTPPEFLAATVHELSTKSSRNAAISTTTTIMATLSAVFPSVARNLVNPATTTDSRNFRRDQNQVQGPIFQKPCHLSGPSCQFQKGQPWNSKLRSKETIISGL
jgi:hypothetical protein